MIAAVCVLMASAACGAPATEGATRELDLERGEAGSGDPHERVSSDTSSTSHDPASPTEAPPPDEADAAGDGHRAGAHPTVLTPSPPLHSPADLARQAASEKPALVLVTAPWCLWCKVLEHEVLPAPEVRALLDDRYRFFVVDLDAAPAWEDIDDFLGLPSLVFFDEAGQHVLTKSGYRPKVDVADILLVVADEIARDRMEPYPSVAVSKLPTEPVSQAEATQLLTEWEQTTFIRINSNDGGFRSPARHPAPWLLWELQGWIDAPGSTAPPRVGAWIEKTLKSALRGTSPRLSGEPLPGFPFDDAELLRLAKEGPNAGKSWRKGVEALPEYDPFRGIQDPLDGGVFRYAAGTGWIHPHFERRAAENLAWALLLEARGDARAEAIRGFVARTFHREDGMVRTAQHSNPFYYRLRADERAQIDPPAVTDRVTLDGLAFSVLVDPSRCGLLDPWIAPRWPSWETPARNDDGGFDAPAPPDAAGLLLRALARCPGGAAKAKPVRDAIVDRWTREGLPTSSRLLPLAGGLCASGDRRLCGRAIAAIATVAWDIESPPPFGEVQRYAAGRGVR
jgi:hypothetical protein